MAAAFSFLLVAWHPALTRTVHRVRILCESWLGSTVVVSGRIQQRSLQMVWYDMSWLAENVHALEGLACRKRVAPASSPSLHACCARPSCACFGHKAVKAAHI